MSSFTRTLLAAALGLTALAAQAAPSLTALYTFEGANGNFANVVDASGNGKNPTFFEPNGIVTVTTGGLGYQGEAVKFTPTGSSVNDTPGRPNSGGGFMVPIDISPSQGDLTIGGWVKLKTTSATAGNPIYTFFSHDDGCWDRGLWLQGGIWQTTGGFGCSGPQSTGAGFTQDEWHLIVVSMAGTNASLYIDGVFKSTTGSHDYGTTAAGLRFGAFDRNAGSEPWEGLMDNLFVFSAALNASEVSTINARGLAGIQSVAGLNADAPRDLPEPASLALASVALLGLVAARRAAKRQG
jgi:hypothetical protein